MISSQEILRLVILHLLLIIQSSLRSLCSLIGTCFIAFTQWLSTMERLALLEGVLFMSVTNLDNMISSYEKKLVLPDASILIAKLPGRHIRDCVFTDPARDG